MSSIVLASPARILTACAVFTGLLGCAASESASKPARAPDAVAVQDSSATPANPVTSSRAADENASTLAGAVDPAFDPGVQVVELEIEGMHSKEPMLPCRLLITHHDGTMVLEFRAESSDTSRIRQQAQELGVYLNANRDDESASRSPGGRPDPASFPVRQILSARPVASVQDLPDGARLTLAPDERGRTERLRAQVLWYAGDLLPGLPFDGKTCPELPAAPLAAAAADAP